MQHPKDRQVQLCGNFRPCKLLSKFLPHYGRHSCSFMAGEDWTSWITQKFVLKFHSNFLTESIFPFLLVSYFPLKCCTVFLKKFKNRKKIWGKMAWHQVWQSCESRCSDEFLSKAIKSDSTFDTKHCLRRSGWAGIFSLFHQSHNELYQELLLIYVEGQTGNFSLSTVFTSSHKQLQHPKVQQWKIKEQLLQYNSRMQADPCYTDSYF